MKKTTIAIDGPAGAGKSTIAKIIAKKLNILYVDTGAMYRAIAYYVLKNKIDPWDADSVIICLDDIMIDIKYRNGKQHVILCDDDVTEKLRTLEVSSAASAVAVIPEVREKLVHIQRNIGMQTSLVMDGRDIGTYVLPNADIKIFLTADVTERAKRRLNELKQKGINTSLEQVKKDIEKRDENDTKREFAPLKMADDAILVDTTKKTIEEVVEEITSYL